MKYSEEDIDIMLFDYLEGNLPGDEIKLVESQIAADPLIREELNSWKQSYLKPDHYSIPTEALETQLLRNPGSFSFTLFLNSVLLVCLTLISSKNPTINPSPESIIHRQTISLMDATKPKLHISILPVTVSEQQIKASNDITPIQKVTREPAVIAPSLAQVSEIANLSPKQPEYVAKHPAFIEISNTAGSSVITKKELRKREKALRQMKRKAVRARMASGFLKGDIPYVVPVDPNNF